MPERVAGDSPIGLAGKDDPGIVADLLRWVIGEILNPQLAYIPLCGSDQWSTFIQASMMCLLCTVGRGTTIGTGMIHNLSFSATMDWPT